MISGWFIKMLAKETLWHEFREKLFNQQLDNALAMAKLNNMVKLLKLICETRIMIRIYKLIWAAAEGFWGFGDNQGRLESSI